MVLRTMSRLSLLLVAACAPEKTGNVSAEGTGALVLPSLAPIAFDEELVDACGLGDVTPSGAGRLPRGPYLQQVGPTSARLMFTAATADPIEIDVGAPEGQSATTVTTSIEPTERLAGAHQHVAVLHGLRPGAVHCYLLRAGGEDLMLPAGFRTAPDPGGAEPVRFIVLGDSGSGSPDQEAVAARMETVPVDLVLHTGDVAYESGTLRQLEEHFFDVYGPLLRSVPVYPVTGDHDRETDEGAPFREVFALPDNGGPAGRERWYSFDWGSVHFVALDTSRIGPEQTEWLEADLAGSDRPWTVVYGHSGPYSAGFHGGNRAFRQRFGPILARHGVDLVLSGNDHDYERTHPIDGVTYVVTGGGGKSTYSVGRSQYTAFSEDVLHFVHVTVEGDRLELRAIDATGRTFDTHVLTRPQARRLDAPPEAARAGG